MSKKDSTKTSLNFDLSQLSPAEKKLMKDILKLSKTTKVRPTLVSQKQSPSSYQFVAGRKEQ
jgi:hypothetical protein